MENLSEIIGRIGRGEKDAMEGFRTYYLPILETLVRTVFRTRGRRAAIREWLERELAQSHGYVPVRLDHVLAKHLSMKLCERLIVSFRQKCRRKDTSLAELLETILAS